MLADHRRTRVGWPLSLVTQEQRPSGSRFFSVASRPRPVRAYLDLMLRRLLPPIAAVVLLATTLIAVVAPTPAAAAFSQRWRAEIGGARLEWSSPVIADVNNDGSNDVAVGGTNGVVYVYGADGGRLWASPAGGQANSSPAVGDVDGDGRNELVIGFGQIVASAGGVRVFDGAGNVRCTFNVPPHPASGLAGVFNAPAIGDVNGDGVHDIVFGSFNHRIYAITGGCTRIAEFDNTDTVWSAPSLRNVDGDPELEIFIGGDATASSVGLPHSGGYFRSLEYQGTGVLRERWRQEKRETFQGSSAFATLGGRLAVVTNSGADYCRRLDHTRCGEAQKVWAFDAVNGSEIPGWPRSATYTTFLAGPAVGDINNDGADDVVVGSTEYSKQGPDFNPINGAVDAFLSNGQKWTRTYAGDEVVSPPIIAEVTGGGTPEVVIGVFGQLMALNGPNGGDVETGTAAGSWAHKSAAAVGNLGGAWSLVTAGFDPGSGAGKIGAFAIPPPPGGHPGPWPMFQKNARRLGSDPTDAAPIQCSQGYWLSAADGGIFSFGPQAPFYGSAGNIRLNAPIVGMTAKPDRSGYWFVATDGGIFTYGAASFYGSTGSLRLNRPIVGMAARPQGDGYWLVASDGGIFAFGNAAFHGSAGNIALNSPIVGMAPTPSGNGYWLVAADGGIFTYGDAGFFGSAGNIRLNQPIVGMTATRTGGGYWFVARDGGIFSYGDAPFYGSAGNIVLNQPIVGMRRTPSGNGYWFVATDGGIFSYGDAEFCGSTGSRRLNLPVVGMA